MVMLSCPKPSRKGWFLSESCGTVPSGADVVGVATAVDPVGGPKGLGLGWDLIEWRELIDRSLGGLEVAPKSLPEAVPKGEGTPGRVVDDC